jgi:acyl-CoA reductase-like NAD-dependent aldehyde dehydrogenase
LTDQPTPSLLQTPPEDKKPSQATDDRRPIFVAGRWAATSDELDVMSPTGELAGRTYRAGEAELEEATVAAVAAERPLAAMPAYERAAALRQISEGILARTAELADTLAREAGKPIRDAETEVQRGALVFRVAAEESERMYGEVIPLDIHPASQGRLGIVRRFPVGAIAGITPFNLPLGLAAHKVAPAIAAGCPIVLKPSSETPLTMLGVAAIVAETNLPPGSVSVLPMTTHTGDRLVTDERFKLLSFTGSPPVGWAMKQRAGKKKVVLELGGNAAVIVDASADVERAAQRCVAGSFKYAGQLCISVQRIFVHDSLWESFVNRFVELAGQLKLGDPLERDTDVGPMISRAALERTEEWLADAVRSGARLHCGGTVRDGCLVPTLLSEVPPDSPLCIEEAFAPVAVAARFGDFGHALQAVNDSRFGLQAGVFTNDLAHAWQAYNELHVGAVVINDSPAYRIDHMPYGGVKDSGYGREGIRWTMESLTEPRMMVMVGAK